LAFVFDELHTGLGEIRAGPDKRAGASTARPSRPCKGFAPPLERLEQVIGPEVPGDCVGLEAVRIGQDISEHLDVTPATFRVTVTRRPNTPAAWLTARTVLFRHRGATGPGGGQQTADGLPL
jgi:transposase